MLTQNSSGSTSSIALFVITKYNMCYLVALKKNNKVKNESMYIIESVDLCNKIIMKKKKKKKKRKKRLSVFRVFPVINVILCSSLYIVTYKTHRITPKIIF